MPTFSRFCASISPTLPPPIIVASFIFSLFWKSLFASISSDVEYPISITLSLSKNSVSPSGINKLQSLVIPTTSVFSTKGYSLIFLPNSTESSFILYSRSLAFPDAKYSTSTASGTVIILKISCVKSCSGHIT